MGRPQRCGLSLGSPSYGVRASEATIWSTSACTAARAAGIPLPARPGKAQGKARGKTKRAAAAAATGAVATTADLAADGVAPAAPDTAIASPEVAVEAPAEPAAARVEEAAEEAALPEPAAKANPAKSRARKPITREDILKLYVADSLGYLNKVRADGWGGLTCAESGRVGGMMTRRMKRIENGLDRTTPLLPEMVSPKDRKPRG